MVTQPDNTSEALELVSLRAFKYFIDKTQNLLSQEPEFALEQICAAVMASVNSKQVFLLLHYAEDVHLEFAAAAPPLDKQPAIFINTDNKNDTSQLNRLRSGSILSLHPADIDESLSALKDYAAESFTILPLHHEEDFLGALLITDDMKDPQAYLLNTLRGAVASAVHSVISHSTVKAKLEEVQQEAEIFRQIDIELSDIIELNYVFTMIMDWALRFTNADAAGLSLYNPDSDSLRAVMHYGYRAGMVQHGEEIPTQCGGIALRVARSGRAEIVADVTTDQDYFSVADGIVTHMSIPIKREDRVIAVLSLETREFNGFTDEHLEFVRKLTSRAGVAVDNARLFSETEREREKLAYILKNITDGVIAVDSENRIILLNYSAMLAFNLSPDNRYAGKLFSDVIVHSELQNQYRSTIETAEDSSGEIALPGGKIYHITIGCYPELGHIIVMQDITHFKEVDKLKTELIATVSHDLKQPLSSMRGYLDLLQMTDSILESGYPYIERLESAFDSMKQLIDDLLDIARIEAGLTLKLEMLDLQALLSKIIANFQEQAKQKEIRIQLDIPDGMPFISGDRARLEQIFNNLVSNAVKYTPPEGNIRIYAHVRQNIVRIYIEDDGMGIGPEDQSQIFERFYRVRRPETDSIDGTGLGLAIVKSLVEAHQGKIDLKSELGTGSTFRVTLPLY